MTAGATLRKAASDARRFGPEWIREAGRLTEAEIVRQLRVDTGGDGALSGAPRMKAAQVKVKYTAKAAYVKNAGSKVIWAWLEEGTGAHVVRGKKRGKRRRALRTPYGPRASVRVRGVAAKETWTKGSDKGLVAAEKDALTRFTGFGR